MNNPQTSVSRETTIRIQPFSYHTHSNSLGVFDGRDSIEEMITRAETLGFSEIGISNHLICHPAITSIDKWAPMYFRDYDLVADIYKRVSEEIRTVSLKHKIKVWVGFEVDYFKDTAWERFFENLTKQLDADYYIGANHFIYNSDYSAVNKISYMKNKPQTLDADTLENGLKNHWLNIEAAVKSGYFDFIAHLDQIKDKGFCREPQWDEYRWRIIEALSSTHTAYELSTKGLRKGHEMYPADWIVAELANRKVPVVVSDDAHSTDQLADNFDLAEALLNKYHYPCRFHL